MESLYCTFQTNVTHMNKKQYMLQPYTISIKKITADFNNTVNKGNFMF